MFRASLLLLVLALALPATGSTNAPAAASTNRQIFQVRGVVMGLEPNGKAVRIKHEAIPGYMAAMTMPFDVKDTNELAGLAAGDTASFRMIVTEDDGWIDQIKKREAPAVKLPPNSGITITRDVEQLKEGDLVPDYAFTNELGKRIHLWQFRGKAVAINFLFTRCPFPTFCPLMAKNFADVQKKMLARKDGPTNWQLLTISFDPEFDQPVILRAYANSHGYDPAHWSFATGRTQRRRGVRRPLRLPVLARAGRLHEPQPAHHHRGPRRPRAEDYLRQRMADRRSGAGDGQGGGEITHVKYGNLP